MEYKYNDVTFTCNTDIPEDEAKAYIDRGVDKYGQNLTKVEGKVDGEEIELEYFAKAVPFERIRRITGYLVGTLDRFNDGKRAEERDRVKHSI